MGRGRFAFEPAPNLLAVTYDAATLGASRGTIESREQHNGVSLVREFDYPHTHVAVRVVKVAPGSLAAAATALASAPGVRSVGRTGYRYHTESVTTPYFPGDPYFAGFGPGAPLYEAADSPGQWDKHVERLEDAFAYSQSGNGSGIVNANALGSASIKIAIIDTGEDVSHPELASKIVYTKCFISNPSNVQSTSDFETDPLGHGTDTSGIAAEDTGNAFGFSGSAGKAVIYAYRVFPTPDDSCASETNQDAQCGASSADIASSIEDATANHVNVISMSLGGGSCNGSQDPDPNEGAAVADAIAAGIIVVASSGNDGTSPVDSPACDANVIAAGATSIADGQPNGTGTSSGSATNPNEYVASYSNFGSPGQNVNSASAWGIVAPGGDPSKAEEMGTPDDLHWIENIWTTTPFDDNFAANDSGQCTPDYMSSSNVADCRVLIAGTSMSAPNIAGAAALILSVNSSYQSASAMKTLLCETADDINDSKEGCGRLDVYRAMAKALNDPSPPPARPIP
jgi:subtilisin family serine protease